VPATIERRDASHVRTGRIGQDFINLAVSRLGGTACLAFA